MKCALCGAEHTVTMYFGSPLLACPAVPVNTMVYVPSAKAEWPSVVIEDILDAEVIG